MRFIQVIVSILLCFHHPLILCRPAEQMHFSPKERGIFRMVSESELVAVGEITERGLATLRASPEEISKMPDIPLLPTLYTFKIENLLCRRSDFGARNARSQIPEQDELYIIQTRKDFFREGARYMVNHRYLIFATPVDDQNQLLEKYKLDEQRTYYKALDGKLGLLELPDNHLILLGNITSLCEAVRPPDPRAKLELLRELIISKDPDLRAMAQKAIELVIHNTEKNG